MCQIVSQRFCKEKGTVNIDLKKCNFLMLDFIYSIQGIEVNAQELKKTISWECVGKYEKRNTTEL